jgi:nitrogen-specific signal transduction histidine kinase
MSDSRRNLVKPPVLIDKRQMTQVIINLVKNAYEAIDRQGQSRSA